MFLRDYPQPWFCRYCWQGDKYSDACSFTSTPCLLSNLSFSHSTSRHPRQHWCVLLALLCPLKITSLAITLSLLPEPHTYKAKTQIHRVSSMQHVKYNVCNLYRWVILPKLLKRGHLRCCTLCRCEYLQTDLHYATKPQWLTQWYHCGIIKPGLNKSIPRLLFHLQTVDRFQLSKSADRTHNSQQLVSHPTIQTPNGASHFHLKRNESESDRTNTGPVISQQPSSPLISFPVTCFLGK